MTAAEFYVALAELKDGWKLQGSYGQIRQGDHCPITAVAVARGCDDVFSACDFTVAARFLGLHHRQRSRIINAADHDYKGGLVRKKLLAALGLEAVEA